MGCRYICGAGVQKQSTHEQYQTGNHEIIKARSDMFLKSWVRHL
jgi:hypothetical protein